MCGAQFQIGKLIQRAIENQVRQADGGVERIADGVGEPAVALEAPVQFRRALRVDEEAQVWCSVFVVVAGDEILTFSLNGVGIF